MNKQLLILLILSLTLLNCSKSDDPVSDDPEVEILDISAKFNVLQVMDGKEFRQIIETNDGGYIGIAKSRVYDVYKFNSDFKTIWNKQYGGSNDDYAESIIQTSDGGYLIIGMSTSSDGDVGSNYGGSDIWLCKIDATGDFSWGKNYGGSNSEGVSKDKSLIQTSEGGFLFIGHTKSGDGDISQSHGGYDAWVVKINSTGSIEFESTYGGTSNDFGRKLSQSNDSYTLLMSIGSSNGDYSASGNWLTQINESGIIEWKTNLFGMNSGSICNTTTNGTVIVNTSATGFNLHKLNSEGSIILDKTISFQSSSDKQPFANNILKTSDNGFIVIGDLGGGNDQDAIVFRVSSKFNLIYDKIHAGNDYDKSVSLTPINDNEFMYQIITSSTNLDGINHSGGMSSALFELDELRN